jgi:rhamnogalacturonyl hydrolase YesR
MSGVTLQSQNTALPEPSLGDSDAGRVVMPVPTGDISGAVDHSLVALRSWIEERDYAGYEPFDILSSPLLRSRWARSWPLAIAFIQFGKRYAGLKLRRWLRVPASKNPKALGLILSAYCDMARFGEDTRHSALYLKSELKRLRSPFEPEYCWGYDWDHASRGGRMPAFSSNCIATCFCARALLDMAEVFGDAEAQEMAQSAGRYLVTALNRPVDTPEHLCFSYTPTSWMKVFNASALAGALLARMAPHDSEYSQLARRSMNYLVACQQDSGAWYYGTAVRHRWIDGFHTAYNLEALIHYQRSTGDTTFAGALRRGYDYYIANFFRADGAPKYFYNSVYPIDIHSCSQAILTFCDFAEQDPHARERAERVARWTLDNMRGDDGSFFFQVHRWWTNRAPYMRWGQAWMLHALARLKRKYLSLKIDEFPMKAIQSRGTHASTINR